MSSHIFIDGYQHYNGNSNKCRQLAGTADESARTNHAHSSVTCAYRPHMHTRYTTDARRRLARASTRRPRSGATGAPQHAAPTTPRRPLRQPRAKRTLPALRPATCALRQLQREEEGVAVSLPDRRRCPPQRGPLVPRHPPGQSHRTAHLKARNHARHCQLRAENHAFARGKG